ncbi:hypothetical protein [Streptomyces enissocaesilis]|uniref:Uncharacterized protein n=1 Tax=Streptomyces enissocaesilis TaxID=332589 RepID=A0ABP6JB56_9ACTN
MGRTPASGVRPTGFRVPFGSFGSFRTDPVNAAPPAVWGASTDGPARRGRGFLGGSENPYRTQEHPMADLAFAVTTLAVFALMALVAEGVAKL